MKNSIVILPSLRRVRRSILFCPSNHRIVLTFRPLTDKLGVDWDQNVMAVRQFSGIERGFNCSPAVLTNHPQRPFPILFSGHLPRFSHQAGHPPAPLLRALPAFAFPPRSALSPWLQVLLFLRQSLDSQRRSNRVGISGPPKIHECAKGLPVIRPHVQILRSASAYSPNCDCQYQSVPHRAFQKTEG